MIRRTLSLLIFIALGLDTAAQILPAKGSDEAWSYDQIIKTYKKLDSLYSNAVLLDLGPTDAGRSLSLFLMQSAPLPEEFTLQEIADNKLVTLINNGIHPGESCGMDASLQWSQEVLSKGGPSEGQLIAIIPVYNIGGSLNRRPESRANQNGPALQGFRGNASNLDLNRDFIKADALNTTSFWAIYQSLKPAIFIDTHTSNGADYPYTLTLIASQKDKLAPPLGDFQSKVMVPYLFENMQANWPLIPYVNVFGRPPNKGYAAFLDLPRFASGYTALFHSLSFITEAHMFKPYKDRVAATYEFFQVVSKFAEEKRTAILEARKLSLKWEKETRQFPIQWELDSTDVQQIPFLAYSYQYEESELGNYQRLKYNRAQVLPMAMDYYPSYYTKSTAILPKYYVIPQAWHEVLRRLSYHQIKMQRLERDTLISVESIYLKDWEHGSRPYEGHFRTEIKKVERIQQKRLFLEGDYLVYTDGPNPYFLATVLDPMAIDSYLSWGFFNPIFQQKEYFSPYVFEDRAMEMLKSDPQLAKEFEQWKADNPQLLSNPYVVLSFFYRKSSFYEDEHLRYPVAEIPY